MGAVKTPELVFVWSLPYAGIIRIRFQGSLYQLELSVLHSPSSHLCNSIEYGGASLVDSKTHVNVLLATIVLGFGVLNTLFC